MQWVTGPCAIHWRSGSLPDGTKVFRLYFDTGSARAVGYFRAEDLKSIAEELFRAATGGLTLADTNDLRSLRDAAPFE